MFSSRLVPVSCTARSLCVTFARAARKVNLSLATSGWGHGARLPAVQVHGDTTTPGRGLGNPIPPTQLPPGIPQCDSVGCWVLGSPRYCCRLYLSHGASRDTPRDACPGGGRLGGQRWMDVAAAWGLALPLAQRREQKSSSLLIGRSWSKWGGEFWPILTWKSSIIVYWEHGSLFVPHLSALWLNPEYCGTKQCPFWRPWTSVPSVQFSASTAYS